VGDQLDRIVRLRNKLMKAALLEQSWELYLAALPE
jgi:hypothetical protein